MKETFQETDKLCKTTLQRMGKIFFVYRLYYNRTHQYLGSPKELVADFMLLSVYLKLFGLYNVTYIVIGMILFVVGAILFGKWEVNKARLAHIEDSVSNQLNPELMAIHKSIKGKDGRKKEGSSK